MFMWFHGLKCGIFTTVGGGGGGGGCGIPE